MLMDVVVAAAAAAVVLEAPSTINIVEEDISILNCQTWIVEVLSPQREQSGLSTYPG
jgi:hypothetical protein